MKKRSVEILQRLLKVPHRGLALNRLMDDYHITEKTLRGDIQEIIDFTGASSVLADSHTLRLKKGTDPQEIEKRLEVMDLYDYKLSSEEREYYIVVELLQQEDYISMQTLADDLYVTRATIVNDCKEAAAFFAEHKIPFIFRNKLGMKADAGAGQRRNLLIDLFGRLLLPLQESAPFFPGVLARKLGFSAPFPDMMRHMLAYTRDHNIFFAKETADQLAVCLFVLLNDYKPSTDTGEPPVLDGMGEMAAYIADCLNLPLSRRDIPAIEKVILQRDLKPQIQSINDFELYGVISHFLLRVGQSIGAELQHDDLLVQSLLSHIKNMKNWGPAFEFDLDGSFPDLARIRKSAEDNYDILENYLHYRMNRNMKDSIVIHICAAICRQQKSLSPSRVLISCPGSMATGKYLEAQVRSYLNLQIVGVAESGKIEAGLTDLSRVDFVISTVQIHACPVPVAVVSPLLTLEDINLIQTLSFRNGVQSVPPPASADYPLLERLHEVYATGDSKKIAWLDQELSRVLAEVQAMESKTARTSALLNMLDTKYIRLSGESLDWRSAMELAAEDLIRDGFFGTAYVEKAIENVEEYGSYIIISQGIALAHANRESGVYKDGLGLLISRDGIRFEDGEVVYMLFFFSTKGTSDYLQLFKEIIKLGNQSGNMQKMRRTKTPETAYRLMMEILTDYQDAKEKGRI